MRAQFGLLVLFTLCSLGFSQDQCAGDMLQVHQCMENSRPKDDDMRNKMKTCFDQAGCSMPSGGPNGGNGGPPDGGNGPNMDDGRKVGECIEGKLRPILEECVRSKGATVPNFPKDHHGPPPGGPPNDMPPMGRGRPNCQKPETLMPCLQGLQGQMQNKFKDMCEAKTKCFAAVSQSCQEAFKKTKKAFCDCASENKDKISTEMNNCFSSAGMSAPPMDMHIKHMCEEEPDCNSGPRGPFPGGPFPGGPPDMPNGPPPNMPGGPQ